MGTGLGETIRQLIDRLNAMGGPWPLLADGARVPLPHSVLVFVGLVLGAGLTLLLLRLVRRLDAASRPAATAGINIPLQSMRSLLDRMPTGAVIINPKSHIIVEANQVACQLIGAERDAVVGRMCHRYICPAQVGRCPITDLGQAVDQAERVLVAADGREIPILKSVAEVRLDGQRYLLESFTALGEVKRIQQQTAAQNAFLNTVLESLTHPFYVIDARTREILMANRAAVGDKPVKGRLCHQVSHYRDEPCDGVGHPCPLEQIKREGRPVTVEHIHRDALGQARTVEVHGYPVFDEHGEVVQVIEYCQDITRRKQAAAALRKSEERFRLIFEDARDAIIWTDSRTASIVNCNKAAENLLGRPRDEIIGCPQSMLFPEGQAQACQQRLLEAAAHDDSGEIEAEVVTRDGRTRHVRITTSPTMVGDTMIIQGIFHDITDRRRAEQALRESETLLRATLDSTADGILVVNQQGKALVWNSRFLEMWKIPAEMMTEQTDQQLRSYLSEQVETPATLVTGDPQDGACNGQEYVTLRTRDGRVLERFSCPLAQDGSSAGRVWSFRDMTEHIRAQEALCQSQQRFQRAVRGSTDGIWDWDPNTNSVWFSPRFKALLGYGENEFPDDYETWKAHLHPEDMQPTLAAIQAHVERGEPYDTEHRLRTKNGDYRWFRSRGVAEFDEQGQPQRMSGSIQDIHARYQAQQQLREKEAYLRAITSVVQTGLMISEAGTNAITDVNPYTAHLLGRERDQLLGQRWDRYLRLAAPSGPAERFVGGVDAELITARGERSHVRVSQATTRVAGSNYTVHSFLDISDIKHLLEEQAVNIELATRLLHTINEVAPRHVPLGGDHSLFVDVVSAPCRAAGGDHYLVRTLDPDDGPARTVISIKDQSGHEVNCVLRSILTDLLHNRILLAEPGLDVTASMCRLNDEIVRSGLFAEDDFLTTVTVGIEHDSLLLHYVSCGHPVFFVLRGNEVITLPDAGQCRANLPVGSLPGLAFHGGQFQLQQGDQLLLYTDGLTDMGVAVGRPRLETDELTHIIRQWRDQHPCGPVRLLVRHLLEHCAARSGADVAAGKDNLSNDDITVIGMEVEGHRDARGVSLKAAELSELEHKAAELAGEIAADWEPLGLADAARRIRTVLTEAVCNAWRHGNQHNPQLPVEIRWWAGNDCHLEVTDCGRGFDWRQVPDPRSTDNLLRESGRGIFMMRRCVDQLRWEDGGRRLVTTFRCTTQTSPGMATESAETTLLAEVNS